MTLTVRVIAPDKTVWDAPAEEIVLPSTTGQLGILTGHAPLLTALDTGVLRVRAAKNQEWKAIALLGGFAEVEENEVTILVNGAERGDTINLEQARTAFNEAQARLNQVTSAGSPEEARQAQIQATQAFKRARARFQAAGGSV
ncbi:ATP synthase F1 subunit epsilon [Calothrix sp. PCC 7507]|uniref:ATP synthase F1 subunit epsilon n=1 Tax=Calothrix sp. PCC 7507 TaxID=99598 RepID=UPI00029F0A6E|nr:ATP synthase F1 subunit epsilon [Calothrix sp. PCC 7507]AFY33069.1 ATP synthase F1 subcomplex epsilon subunit [Calothrix sp. PCC 7507]